MMEKVLIDSSIINEFIHPEFQMSEIQDLWKSCPCGMLWEAIRAAYCSIITRKEILNVLQHERSVILLPEPLPNFYLGLQQEALLISTDTLLSGAQAWFEYDYESQESSLLEIEPLYILSETHQWMISLSTEYAAGEQECAIMKRRTDF